MKLFYFCIMFCLVILQLLSAQTQRIVLLEEATNASCAPCATYNPILQKFYASHFGGVVSVRYHAWWPGSNDPMYVSAATDCRTRINYYGINAVPAYVLDGTPYGVPSDYETMVARMEERLKIPAPLKINIRTNISEDSLTAKIKLIILGDVSATDLYLRVAVTQRMVSYPSPPGSNGEKDFPEVLRKMLPNATGISLAPLSMGDTLNFEVATPLKSEWEVGDLAVVSWVQSDVTREVVQANIDFPTFILESKIKDIQFASANSLKKLPYFIFNRNDTTIHVQLQFKEVRMSAGWDCWFETADGDDWHNPIAIAAGDTLYFDAVIQSADFGSLSASIFAENIDDPGFYGEGYGYGFKRELTVFVPENADLLFVDDDGGAEYETNFLNIFDKMNIRYVALSEQNTLHLSQQFDLNNYRLIIWNISWGFPAFSEEDIALLSQYLDGGGSLAILGQDIGWDIFDPQGNSHFQNAMDFIHDYFDAKYVSDNSNGIRFSGVAGDPIGDGLSFDLARPYGFSNFFPEELESYSGKSTPVFRYDNGKIGALRYDGGVFKTVYFGVGLEQIADETARDSVLARILKWTAGITDIPDNKAHQVGTFNVLNNFPNPFNSSTRIMVKLKQASHVEMYLYNIRGRQIRSWKGDLPAGKNYFVWNGRDQHGNPVASGVYFLSLKTESQRLLRKMILVR
ncbi:Omp28-related outer membrane protein [Calditrichota bacterium LG25]